MTEDNRKEQSNENKKEMELNIGNTTYIVTLNFKKDGKETYQDKVIRLLKREIDKID